MLNPHEDRFCGCGCGEEIPNYVRGVFYKSAECAERAEGRQIDPDPARDTIADLAADLPDACTRAAERAGEL